MDNKKSFEDIDNSRIITGQELILKKTQILSNIEKAAKLYDKTFSNRDVLFLCEGKIFEASFTGGNFRHLCGVSSDISSFSFYCRALGIKDPTAGQILPLTINDFYFKKDSEKKINSALEKTETLIKIISNLSKRNEIVIAPKTESNESFPFALHCMEQTDPCSICFAEDGKKNPVPASVRTRNRDLSFGYGYDDVYKVDFILTKPRPSKKNKFQETKYKEVVKGIKGVDIIKYLSVNEIFNDSIDTQYLKNKREKQQAYNKEHGITEKEVVYKKAEHVITINTRRLKEGESLTSTPFANLLSASAISEESKVKEVKIKKKPVIKIQGYNTVGAAITGKNIAEEEEENLDKDGI